MQPKLPGRSTGKSKQLLIFYFMSKFNKLSRTEMKNVLGGYVAPPIDCKWSSNSSCGGGSSIKPCSSGTAQECQDAADYLCSRSNCCDDVDCR